jgi:hypothetical protein
MANLFRFKAQWDDKPRYRVLLQAEFTHKKAMDNVLGSQEQLYFSIDWYGQRWKDDVVGPGRIG